jgi:hypothetical protein
MKRNIIVAAGTALVLAFSLNNSSAQNDASAPGPATATNQAPRPPNASPGIPTRFAADNPNQPPGPAGADTNSPLLRRLPPGRFRQGHPLFSRALGDLRAVKMELQREQGDLGGHKDSAIEACDKAMQELAEVMKALPPPPSPRRLMPPPSGAALPPGSPPAAPPAPAAPPGQPQH